MTLRQYLLWNKINSRPNQPDRNKKGKVLWNSLYSCDVQCAMCQHSWQSLMSLFYYILIYSIILYSGVLVAFYSLEGCQQKVRLQRQCHTIYQYYGPKENGDSLMAHSVRGAYTKMFDYFLNIVEEKWVDEIEKNNHENLLNMLRCTRPTQSQSGAIFCHLNHYCVVFKSTR